MKDEILMGLNTEQKEAVEYVDGPSVILAGAGSGKTRVLIHKVAHLIMNIGVPARAIVMITFTNKAAGEMKDRIQKMLAYLGSQPKDTGSSGMRSSASPQSHVASTSVLGFVGTFHSFCARLLRMHGELIGLRKDYVIYTDQDQEDLIKQILKKTQTSRITAGFVLHKISDAKNQLIGPEDYLQSASFYKAAHVAEVYYEYQEELKKHHAVDFDDLIMRSVQLLRTHPDLAKEYQTQYTHLMVDEFQDTNIAQYALSRIMAPQEASITVVGDFSQAIYSWRGADIRNLERFSQDYPSAKIFYLEQNYRSTQQILDYAYSKIVHNETHPILKLFTHAEIGPEVVEHEEENEEYEALFVGKTILELTGSLIGESSEIQKTKSRRPVEQDDIFSRFAVLYRTNAQSRIIEEVFLTYGIPYTLVGGTRFYDRKEVRDVLAYLRLIVAPEDPVAVERIRKLGKRRWEKFVQSLPDLQEYAVSASTETILDLVLAKSNYLELFNKDDPEDYARLENIRELKNVASNQNTLTSFFEQIALIENEYSVGERKKQKGKGVRLMSLHASKGLEFETVFITGLEDGLLPHIRSLEDRYALEEERRLFYVGITRAKKHLYICWVKRRGLFGRRNYTTKSRFIIKPEEQHEPYDIDPSVSTHNDDWEW